MSDIPIKTNQTPTKAVMDRRAFMGTVMATTGAAAALSVVPFAALEAAGAPAGEAAAATPEPVGTVFMDMPYVDMTGTAEPYVPPEAVGDQTRARTPEEDVWHTHFYI